MSLNRDEIDGGKYRAEWYGCSMEGVYFPCKNEEIPPWPYGPSESEALALLQNLGKNQFSSDEKGSDQGIQGRRLKSRKYPGGDDGKAKKPKCSLINWDAVRMPYRDSSSSGGDDGKVRKVKCSLIELDAVCMPHGGSCCSGTEAEERKSATSCHMSTSNPSMKAEEQNVDTSPLRLPSSTGGDDGKAKKPKCSLINLDAVCMPYGDSSSSGGDDCKAGIAKCSLIELDALMPYGDSSYSGNL